MKTTMILIGLFFLSFPLKSQSILPDSIVVLFYTGGDYREEEMLGAFDDKDSLILNLVQEENNLHYVAEESVHLHKIYPFENGGFQENINEHFKLVRNFNLYIRSKDIEELISLIDYSKYEEFTLIDSIGVLWDSTKFVLEKDSVYIPKDFSINYFGVDSSFIKNNCEYYFNKFEEDLYFLPYKTCEYPIDFKKLTEDFIKFGIEDVIHSSYTSFVSVKLKYKDRIIQLYQYDPGGFKTSWWITNNKSKERIRILNPKINEIISKMLPENFSRIKRLNEYRDIELIYNSYFH